MGIALTSAETGHLVFETLHTSSAAKTISRVIDVFPSEQQQQVRSQLASNLMGVISQILLPRIDQPGRIVACEVMKANAAIRNNVRTGKLEAIFQTIQTSASEGMITMDQSLANMVKDGKVSFNDALPYIHDKVTLESLRPFSRPKAPSWRPSSSNVQPGTQSAADVPPWNRRKE